VKQCLVYTSLIGDLLHARPLKTFGVKNGFGGREYLFFGVLSGS
jgi:hypothetical protein